MTGNFGQYLATMVGEGIADEKRWQLHFGNLTGNRVRPN
jgi:hypothetical protein